MRTRWSVGALAALVLLTVPVSIASAVELTRESRSNLVIETGISRPVQLSRPVRAVILGNPTIVDAAVQSSQLVVLIGKRPGRTNVMFLDDKNLPIDSTFITVFPPPPSLTP